jgi:anti-sigma28 factor (negative regulator of flagellin synthesis)
VLDIEYLLSKSGPDDVRWEKVEHIKRILSNGTFPVPSEEVAARIIEQILEGGHANRREDP